MYKFPQNNLYSYNMIAHNLRKIHISGNGEKNNCSKIDIYTKVYINLMLVKKWKALFGKKIGNI